MPATLKATKKRPARFISVIGRTADGSADLVRIVEGTTTDYYRVRRANRAGAATFFVAKVGSTECYSVDAGKGHESCECMAWLRWNRCRHVSGVQALDAAGKLS